MNRNTIAKFGGTSLKTASAINQIAKILEIDPRIRVVVVSAVGGITNLLVEICNTPANMRETLIQRIRDIHINLAHELELNIENKIIGTVEKLESLTELATLAAEAMDNVISLGEDLSSYIVHAYLISQDINATLVDARDYIVTDDHFGKATPDISVIRDKTDQLPDNICIIQGFIGSTPDGRTTSLGRGGSDYTASLIAEAIHADELLIYTDVPGVYTMDPNIVSQTRPIPELSFQEMAEMANFGAKILHPTTLEPCVRGKIPLRILSTFEPNKAGTQINVTEEKNNIPNIRAIMMRKEQVLVTLNSLKMLNAYGFLANIFSILAKYKISVDLITTSEVRVALTIDDISTGYHSLNPFIADHDLLDELEKFTKVTIEENLTLITVIGSSLTTPGVIQKILGIVDPCRIRLVCYGASNSGISILVHKDSAVHIAKTLHQQLLENTNVR